jgi:hypothetical protein
MTSNVISVKRGDTWRVKFIWKDSSGNVYDLTGCMANLQVRSSSWADPVVDATTANGLLTIVGEDGEIDLEVPAATMAEIRPGKYQSDLQVTFADGSIHSSKSWDVLVVEDITR